MQLKIQLLALFALSSATHDARTAAEQHAAHRCRWNDKGECMNQTQQMDAVGAPGVQVAQRQVTVCVSDDGEFHWHSQDTICTNFERRGCPYGDACCYMHPTLHGSYTDVSERDYSATLGPLDSLATVTQSTDPAIINDWCMRYVIDTEGRPRVETLGFDTEWTSQAIHGRPQFIGAVTPQWRQALLRPEGADTFKAISLIQLAADTAEHGTQVLLYPVARYCAGARFPEGFPATLRQVLANHQIEKVGIQCVEDAVAVLNACGIEVNGAREALSNDDMRVNPDEPRRGLVSLGNMCTALCNFNDWKPKNRMVVRIANGNTFKYMDKPVCPITCSDWCQRLTQRQIDYAALDAITGLRLYDVVQSLSDAQLQDGLAAARELQVQQGNALTPRGAEIEEVFQRHHEEFFLQDSGADITDITNFEDLPTRFNGRWGEGLKKAAQVAFHRFAVARGYL